MFINVYDLFSSRSGRSASIKQLKPEGVVRARMISHEHKHAEVVGQDVGEFKPRKSRDLQTTRTQAAPPGPSDRKADRIVDGRGYVPRLDDDDLQSVAEGVVPVGVELPGAQADQSAEVWIKLAVGKRGG